MSFQVFLLVDFFMKIIMCERHSNFFDTLVGGDGFVRPIVTVAQM